MLKHLYLNPLRMIFGATLFLSLAACSSASVVSSRDITPTTAAVRPVVYVADFELDADAIKSRPHLLHLPRLLRNRAPQAEQVKAQMTTSIIAELAKQGIDAYRLAPEMPRPQGGWLVRGVFLQVDEGDRLRRAVIGFGSGQVNIEVAAALDRLSSDTIPAPIYDVRTDARSGRLPGAVVTLNPYVAAFKFIIAGHDVDRETAKTAVLIADRVAQRLKAAVH